MIIDEAFDAEKRIEFLQSLIQDAGKKVFLILDNLRGHHSKLVMPWVKSTDRPSYDIKIEAQRSLPGIPDMQSTR